MRAAVLHAHGAVPEVGEHAEPAPVDGAEVLQVVAAAMNPVDARIASGAFALERRDVPYIAGKEGVGRRADGTLVYFDEAVPPFGAFAERTLVPAGHGQPLPDGLDPALAVCLGVSGMAAWLGLQWRGRLEPGETVLVLGASGIVGQIAVQVANLLGAGRVVAAARDAGGLERAAQLGADATVQLPRQRPGVPYGDELPDRLRAASGGAGYDLVLDPLWGEPAGWAIAALKPFGRIVNLGQSADAKLELSSAAVRSKPIDILGYTNYTAGAERRSEAYAQLSEHAAAGRIVVEVERFGLADVPAVWRRQGSSPHTKQVVEPAR